MRKIILAVAIFLYGTEITFDKNIKCPTILKEKFIKYWKLRGEKLFDKTYKYEMPYLRYLYQKDEYKIMFKNAPIISKIKIKSCKCKNNKCVIGMSLLGVFFKDLWIKVDNQYYHRFNDKLVPF